MHHRCKRKLWTVGIGVLDKPDTAPFISDTSAKPNDTTLFTARSKCVSIAHFYFQHHNSAHFSPLLQCISIQQLSNTNCLKETCFQMQEPLLPLTDLKRHFIAFHPYNEIQTDALFYFKVVKIFVQLIKNHFYFQH